MTEVNLPDMRKQKMVLFLLIAVFVTPIIVSWWLISFTTVGRGGNDGGHGELIVPPEQIPDLVLQSLNGAEPVHRLYGKWSLLYLLKGACNDKCEKGLFTMRQLRLAMGKDAHRVQRVLLIAGGRTDIFSPAQKAAYKGQLIITGANIKARPLLDYFEHTGGDAAEQMGRLYVIDPLGNLMMSYSPETDPAGIIKDLKRLLKYSQIG